MQLFIVRYVSAWCCALLSNRGALPACVCYGLNQQDTGRRPELLLDSEFERLPAALAKLAAAFPASDVGKMVAAQPLLLVEDIDIIIDELRRCALS